MNKLRRFWDLVGRLKFGHVLFVYVVIVAIVLIGLAAWPALFPPSWVE